MGVYALDSHKKAFTAFIFKAIVERRLFRAIERDGTVELVDERSHELHVKRHSVFSLHSSSCHSSSGQERWSWPRCACDRVFIRNLKP